MGGLLTLVRFRHPLAYKGYCLGQKRYQVVDNRVSILVKLLLRSVSGNNVPLGSLLSLSAQD
jgi:hypothetical protein